MRQYKDKAEIDKQLNINFANVCEWFANNKLCIHFGEDKLSFLVQSVNWKRLVNLILQHSSVTYLDCILNAPVPGKSMAFKTLITSKLSFLGRKRVASPSTAMTFIQYPNAPSF